jgi:hypothetical protein
MAATEASCDRGSLEVAGLVDAGEEVTGVEDVVTLAVGVEETGAATLAGALGVIAGVAISK